MRLGFISDLHIDVNPKVSSDQYLPTLSDSIKFLKLDLFVIGGDIANDYLLTIEFVEQLQELVSIPVYFVPGNHDYWQMNHEKVPTQEIHQQFIEHPQSLLHKPLKINEEYGLVGHSAWYNHAYHDPKFTEEALEIGKYRHGKWQDKEYIDWGMTDKEVSHQFAQQIDDDLNKLSTKSNIIVTHMITYPGYIVPMPHKVFDFFNAYIATDDLLSIYEKHPITHSVMGHVHFRAERMYNGTQMIVNSLGYWRQWRTESLQRELMLAINIIEI